MALSEGDLADFVERVRQQSALDSRRAIQLRAVEPLLETLGWDPRTPAVEPDAALGGTRVDYALVVDGTPVVAVQTTTPDADLEEAAADLAAALAAVDLDWGLLTDAERYVFLARTAEGVHRRCVALEALPDAREVLSSYTPEARAVDAATGRDAAYRRLRERREEAVAAVTDALVGVAGDAIEDEARESAARLVDHLVETGPQRDGSVDPAEVATADASADRTRAAAAQGDDETGDGGGNDTSDRRDGEAGDRQDGEASDHDGHGARDGEDATGSTPDATDASDASPDADGGEYVVRFFGGNSSVGAVGTETPGGTLAGAVTYLHENHGLAQAVTLPWGVTEGTALLAGTPEHPGGDPMEPRAAVADDCYVWTGASPDRTRAAIEELADAVGLRVMFQGDW